MTAEVKREVTPERIIASGVFNYLQTIAGEIRDEHPEARFKLSGRFEFTVFTEKPLTQMELNLINQRLDSLRNKNDVDFCLSAKELKDHDVNPVIYY